MLAQPETIDGGLTGEGVEVLLAQLLQELILRSSEPIGLVSAHPVLGHWRMAEED